MARIVHSDLAPEEQVHYSFSGIEFDLGGDGSEYETDDRAILSNAEAHPWLDVEYDEVAVIGGEWREPSVAPEDDVLSAQNTIAFNEAEIAKVEQEKFEARAERTAIESGLDQGEVIETDSGVNLTVAADEEDAVDVEPEDDVTGEQEQAPAEGEVPAPTGPVDPTGDPDFEAEGPAETEPSADEEDVPLDPDADVNPEPANPLEIDVQPADSEEGNN